jgi:transcriptional regulator with XRE-family HTH domain
MAYFPLQDFLESAKEEMIFQHLTQASLGAKCGYSRKTINRIFNHPGQARVDQLELIAKTLRLKTGIAHSEE